MQNNKASPTSAATGGGARKKPKPPTAASSKAPLTSTPNERRLEEPLAGIIMNRASNQLNKATKKLWLPVNSQNV